MSSDGCVAALLFSTATVVLGSNIFLGIQFLFLMDIIFLSNASISKTFVVV